MAQTDSDTIQNTVIRIVAATLRLKPEAVSPDSHLEKDLGADSLDAIAIAEELEEQYHIEIPNEEVQNFQTIQAIVQGIEKLVPERTDDAQQ